MRVNKKDFVGPIQQAPIGSVWMLDVGGKGEFVWIAVVVGEKNQAGNYPLLMLDKVGIASTKPGQRLNAAVTTARDWRRID